MSKIIVKQASTVQQFQDVGGAPSFMELAGRAFAPRGTGGPQMDSAGSQLPVHQQQVKDLVQVYCWVEIGAGLTTAVQTAHSLQGGNMGAALNAPLTYQGLNLQVQPILVNPKLQYHKAQYFQQITVRSCNQHQNPSCHQRYSRCKPSPHSPLTLTTQHSLLTLTLTSPYRCFNQ